MKKFTDRFVLNLKPQTARYDMWEGNGLGVRVSPQGRKSWVMVYRFAGKPRYATLGAYPAMTVAQAHEAHAAAKAALEQGIDPGARLVEAHRAERAAPTVATLVDEYLVRHVRPRLRSAAEYERILNKEVVPAWGTLKAKDVTRRDVLALLDGVAARGGVMANQTLAVVRGMFHFGIDRALIETNPCTRVKPPAPRVSRDRVLSADEVKAVWTFLDPLREGPMTPGIKLALRLMLVTAQRKHEVVSARWEHIDWQARTWTIPARTAKNGKAHTVPLSTLAISTLERALHFAGTSPWVFPGPRNCGAAHVGETAVDHALLKALPAIPGLPAPFTPHDLRRTVATHLGALGTSRLTISRILNHADKSVTAIYDRHSYLPEMRAAMDEWGAQLRNAVLANDGNVRLLRIA